MERLTDSKVADDLRHNIAGLRAAGIEPDIEYIRYVRLAELEEAADVQPVKRGRWESPVSVGNGIKFCSVCRNEAYWDTDYGQQLFDYCPYCGARMDGDNSEN